MECCAALVVVCVACDQRFAFSENTTGTIWCAFQRVLAFIRMSLRLDQSVITSADSCSIGTLVLLQTSNTVLSSTYLNMGHGVCKSLI